LILDVSSDLDLGVVSSRPMLKIKVFFFT